MVWYTSDAHIDHQGILVHVPQRLHDFVNVETMIREITAIWNDHVAPSDTVYCLGDMILDRRRLIPILGGLNGQKHLIKGDHDRASKTKLINSGYRSVSMLSNITVDDMPITLCHWCMRVWRKSHYNSSHLYGHSHGRLPPIGKSYDVGMDNRAYPDCIRRHVNYAPYSHNEIKAIMRNARDNFNLVKDRR